jgi:hypothetical protein
MLGDVSTTAIAIILAGVGILCVIGVSYAFYLVGRAEDRDRAAEAAARQPGPPAEKPEGDHAHSNGRIARERRRPMPPRRP